MRLVTSGVASLPSYLNQDSLHGEVTLPLCVFPGKTYLAVSLIYAGQVDL
jgi:hypothetical protein